MALFPSREGYFSLRWIRGICAIKRRACLISSERHIGELGARCFSTLNRVRDSMQQSLFGSTGIITVSLRSQVRRTSNEWQGLNRGWWRKSFAQDLVEWKLCFTFALAKETNGLVATQVVWLWEIFEIIDIDKQKCSNKRLGKWRPNRQLRPLLR